MGGSWRIAALMTPLLLSSCGPTHDKGSGEGPPATLGQMYDALEQAGISCKNMTSLSDAARAALSQASAVGYCVLPSGSQLALVHWANDADRETLVVDTEQGIEVRGKQWIVYVPGRSTALQVQQALGGVIHRGNS